MSDSLTVLIAEDDPHVLLGYQQALALEDIPSIGVSSAEEALAQVDADFAGIRQRYSPARHRRPGAAHPPQAA